MLQQFRNKSFDSFWKFGFWGWCIFGFCVLWIGFWLVLMLLLGFDLFLGFAFYDAFCWGFSIVLGRFNCCSYQRPKLWLAVMFWFLGLICFRGFLSVIRVCTGSNRNKVEQQGSLTDRKPFVWLLSFWEHWL